MSLRTRAHLATLALVLLAFAWATGCSSGNCLGWVKDSVLFHVSECGQPALIDGVHWSREGDGSGELMCLSPRTPCPVWGEGIGWGTFTLTIHRGDESWEETVVVRPDGPRCTQPITEELWVEIGEDCGGSGGGTP